MRKFNLVVLGLFCLMSFAAVGFAEETKTTSTEGTTMSAETPKPASDTVKHAGKTVKHKKSSRAATSQKSHKKTKQK